MEWHLIPELPKYSINELGQIKSSRKILNQWLSRHGYYRVCLFTDVRRSNGLFVMTNRHVHRLLAQVFLPNPLNLEDVNHINGIKTDNRLENLEWCSRLENIRHAYRLGLAPTGERMAAAKLKDENIADIVLSSDSNKILAIKYNVSTATINAVKKRITWKHVTV